MPIAMTLPITLNTTPPAIVITNPAANVVSQPMIQLQGYSVKPLSHLSFDVMNLLGVLTNQPGFITDQYYDTNLWQFTTNYFQCYDIALISGTNIITIHATDLAGNTTITNFVFTLDFSSRTNPLEVQLIGRRMECKSAEPILQCEAILTIHPIRFRRK